MRINTVRWLIFADGGVAIASDSPVWLQCAAQLRAVTCVKRLGFSEPSLAAAISQSLIEVKRGGRDIAAIDCVTYALLQRHEPTLLAGLTVIDQTPLTTADHCVRTTPKTLHAIRDALTTLVSARNTGACVMRCLSAGLASWRVRPGLY